MKKIALMWFVVSIFGCTVLSASEAGIGEEYVTPLNYPKFSLTGDYSLGRWYRGFADASLQAKVDNRFGAGLSFEAGILKYMNAGALFSITFSQLSSKKEPVDWRLGIFARPYLPLGQHVSIFARTALGLTVPTNGSALGYLFLTSQSFAENYGKVYLGQKYMGLPFGGFGSATVGIDYFPFSRMGISLEWGIRADILHIGRTNPFEDTAPEAIPNAPNSFNYMMYEMPFMLTVHAIL